jgi:serine/threonine protein kinase
MGPPHSIFSYHAGLATCLNSTAHSRHCGAVNEPARSSAFFVSIVAAYTTKDDLNLVMQSRANGGDLAIFLEVYLSPKGKPSDSKKEAMTITLERAFGCGASGLAFMHQKRIRHRDMKPHNILIHNCAIVYADFGYSRDSSLFEQCATIGPVDAQTKRYSAREVLLWDERDSRCDVYSLGCVFIEVFFTSTVG